MFTKIIFKTGKFVISDIETDWVSSWEQNSWNYVCGCSLWSLLINFGYYYHSFSDFFSLIIHHVQIFFSIFQNPTPQKSNGKSFVGAAFDLKKLSEQKIGILEELGRRKIAGIWRHSKLYLENFSLALKFLTFFKSTEII